MKRLVLVFVAVFVLVAGCSRPQKEKLIVGKWEEVGGSQRGEFFPDGNVTILGRLQGKWRFLDSGQLCVEATVLGYHVTQTYGVTFDRDTMTMADADENVQTFRKVAAFSSSPNETKPPAPAGADQKAEPPKK